MMADRIMTEEENIAYVTMDENTEYIKIHGLQRSGTNYLSYLINENFVNTKALINLGGWKHGAYSAPWMVGKEVHVLAITKNPYAWLTSVFHYWGPEKKLRIGPDLEGITFEEFVMNRLIAEGQRDVPYLFRASNPVQFWNNWNLHWSSIRLNNKKLHFITYESLINYTEETLNKIGDILDLKRKSADMKDCDETFTPSGEAMKLSGEKFKKLNFYKNQEYLNQFNDDLLKFVNEEVDLELMLYFGYDLVNKKG